MEGGGGEGSIVLQGHLTNIVLQRGPVTSTGEIKRSDRAQGERGKNRETSRTITRTAVVYMQDVLG